MSRKAEKLEHTLIRLTMNYHLAEQSDIQQKLQEQGIVLPQSTLSRWLKKLNIVKVNNRYQIIDAAPVNIPSVISIKASLPNLLVVHTLPGNANSLAYQIDQKTHATDANKEAYQGVLGTIAGDDTILIVMQDSQSLQAFKKKLETLFL